MKCFGLVFSIFGLYFVLPSEAKAEAYNADVYYSICHNESQYLEFTSAFLSKNCSQKLEFSKSVSWDYFLSDSISIVILKNYPIGFKRAYQVITAKEFLIRSGLSPPSVFA